MPFTSHTFEANGQSIHAKIGGPKGAPVMLMLHGFPENWAAWAGVAKGLLGKYRVVLPDQRGFNLSSKPEGQEAYATKHLVADMVALIDQISPNKQIVLCGHDWGASVAYAMAIAPCEPHFPPDNRQRSAPHVLSKSALCGRPSNRCEPVYERVESEGQRGTTFSKPL